MEEEYFPETSVSDHKPTRFHNLGNHNINFYLSREKY
jgi:hypothetical protein